MKHRWFLRILKLGNRFVSFEAMYGSLLIFISNILCLFRKDTQYLPKRHLLLFAQSNPFVTSTNITMHWFMRISPCLAPYSRTILQKNETPISSPSKCSLFALYLSHLLPTITHPITMQFGNRKGREIWWIMTMIEFFATNWRRLHLNLHLFVVVKNPSWVQLGSTRST